MYATGWGVGLFNAGTGYIGLADVGSGAQLITVNPACVVSSLRLHDRSTALVGISGAGGQVQSATIFNSSTLMLGSRGMLATGSVTGQSVITIEQGGLLGTAGGAGVPMSAAFIVGSGGTVLNKDGVVNGLLLQSGGKAVNSGTVSYAYVSGGGSLEISNDARAVWGYNGGQTTIHNRGLLSGYFGVGGTATVEAGGAINHGWIMDGATINVLNGGVLSAAPTLSQFEMKGGQINVAAGGNATNLSVSGGLVSALGTVSGALVTGGIVSAGSGGVLSSTTLEAGGSVNIGTSGLARGLFVWGGTATVETAGWIRGGYITNGGVVNVSSGGYVVGTAGSEWRYTVESGGQLNLSSGAVTSGIAISAGGTLTALAGGNAWDIVFDGGTGKINGRLSGGSIINNGSVDILSVGSAASIANNGGLITVQYGGQASQITINSGGTVLNAGRASDVTVNSGILNVGGGGDLAQGPSSDQVTVNAGGTLHVSAGGMAFSTYANTGGVVQIDSGTMVQGLFLSGGQANVASGADVGTITIASGGVLTTSASLIVDALQSGGTLRVAGVMESSDIGASNLGAEGTIQIMSGGTWVAPGTGLNATPSNSTMEVLSGGSLLKQYAQGGTTIIRNGGFASDLNFGSGASLVAASGSTLGGTITLGNGAQASIFGDTGGTYDLQGTGNAGLVISGLSQGGTANIRVINFDGINSGVSDAIRLAGVNARSVKAVTFPTPDQLCLELDNGRLILLNIAGVEKAGYALQSYGSDLIVETCYLSGTFIRTPEGDVPVESLKAGDEICVFDWQNNRSITRRLVWADKSTCEVRYDLPDDEAGWPVCIKANALAEGIPSRDLRVTSEHCMFFDGHFVPARMLVNGISIFYDKTNAYYEYYHIETEDHSVIWAQDALSESYLDTGHRRSFNEDRSMFVIGRRRHLDWTHAAAPLNVSRSFVEPLYREILDRIGGDAQAAPSAMTFDHGLKLITETGAVISEIRSKDGRHVFLLPCTAETVRLVSRHVRPCDSVGPYLDDRRRFGVAISEITIFEGRSSVRVSSHMSANPRDGWHDHHAPRTRWTNGDALLALDARRHSEEPCLLVITVSEAGPYPELSCASALEIRTAVA